MTTDKKLDVSLRLRGPAAVTVLEAADIIMRSDDFHAIEGKELTTALRSIIVAGAKQVVRDSR